MIDIQSLSKNYGNIQALKNANIKIKKGEIVGLLGPNGAGKTTLIKVITGYLQPDNGSVTIDGFDILLQTQLAQSKIGYLPENAPLYPEQTVQEYLLMMADLRQIPPEKQLKYISDAVYATKVDEFLTRPIGQLSKGMRQRVGLAQAILHKPEILILDEPTVGLDPTQIMEIRQLIKRLAKTSTILFSTHILSEVEALCDRVIIIMNGEIRRDARLSELADTNNAILILEEKVPDAINHLQKLNGVKHVSLQEDTGDFSVYLVEGSHGSDLTPQIYRLATEQKWSVRELKRDSRTLESVFNELAISA